ncbi:hypothetical protein AVEN_188260-1 [Araneus ventricosus]|uniref:Uncharacterized protein n=1 Tax=Araneus ventricosus TaxID=182803 RepID=A0A4Y2KNW6_ARAVE|nr:hypothetical protein AVEN_188260-1 [Araneus ventricosus]
MVLPCVAVWAYPLSARQASLLNSIQRKFLFNITVAYYTTPTAALQIITGILPLPLEAVYVRVSRLDIPSNLSDSNLYPDHFERKVSTANFHPALFNIEERISLGDHHISEDAINFFSDDSKIQDNTGHVKTKC